jgi:pimeloyl-ACP methyl ester carboxylesterase
VVPDAGHVVNLEQPQAFAAALLAFLDQAVFPPA